MAIPDDIVTRASADLQRAKAKADTARATLAAAEAQVSDLEAFLRTLRHYVGAKDEVASTEHSTNNRQPAKAGSRARDLVDAAIDAIKEARRPLPIGELLDAVLAAGHSIGGTDQKSNLAGYLSRDPRVVSRGRSVGWDLVGTEGAAFEPASGIAAPSLETGGTDDGPTLGVEPGRSSLWD